MSVRAPLREAADSLAKASTPEPFSTSKTSNWVARRGGLPDYVQHIAHDIMEKRGKSESEAIQIAIGVVKRWARGGGNVDAGTRAAAAKAVAEWEKMKGAQAAKRGAKVAEGLWIREADAYRATLADEQIVRRDAIARLVVLERQFGLDGLVTLLAEGVLQEAAGRDWAPTLKRTASSSSEIERHEVHDASGQMVGTLARRKSYDVSRPDRYTAHSVNGERVTDYSGASKTDALEALRKHLEEAPARVGKHSSGKWLVARPASYSGPDTFAAYPSESAARYAAGLPEKPSVPEQGSQVQALAEMVRFDALTVAGLGIVPLARLVEAAAADPLALLEAFRADELRDFRGRWQGGGARIAHLARLSPASISPGRARARVSSPTDQRYEGGVKRMSSRLRAAHARKPQIKPDPGPKKRVKGERYLPDAVGEGAWSRSAGRVAKRLLKQKEMDQGVLIDAVKAGKAIDTEHAHRVRNADGSLGAYTPERQALHERIIENMLQGMGVHEGSAQAHFTAGGPASGKSGLEKFGMVKLPHDIVVADPDTIRTQLPEYKALIAAGRADASSLTHEEASHIAKLLTRVALGRQHHVLVDTVGDSGPGKFASKIEKAKRAGYDVHVHYATTDVGTALERARKRAQETGRHVPEEYLREAHREVSKRFIEDISKIRGIHLQVVDTTDRPNTVIASRGPKPGDKLSIKDEGLFRKFLEKAKG